MWQPSYNQPPLSHLFCSPHHLNPSAHEAEFWKLGKEEEEEEVELDELMVPGDKVAPGYLFGGMSQVLD